MDDALDLGDAWPGLYTVDRERLENAASEEPFGEAAFELLKEAGALANLAVGLLPVVGLDRNQAILDGLLLKIAKLIKAVIVMTAHLGGDRQIALLRELLEALVTLHYLLEDDGTQERFDQYVRDSLVAEREFLKTISLNAQARGDPLPVEESMRRSIDATAAAAGVELGTLGKRREIGWPSAELRLRAWGNTVYPSYRMGSVVVHSQWTDLLRNHLVDEADGKFSLRFEEVDPRPQPLYAAGLLAVDLILAYIDKARPEARNVFEPRLANLGTRLETVAELHGSWLDGLGDPD